MVENLHLYGELALILSRRVSSHDMAHVPGVRVNIRSGGIWEIWLLGSRHVFLSIVPPLPLQR